MSRKQTPDLLTVNRKAMRALGYRGTLTGPQALLVAVWTMGYLARFKQEDRP